MKALNYTTFLYQHSETTKWERNTNQSLNPAN